MRQIWQLSLGEHLNCQGEWGNAWSSNIMTMMCMYVSGESMIVMFYVYVYIYIWCMCLKMLCVD